MSQQQKLLFFKGVPLLLTLLAGTYMLLILANSYTTNFSDSSNNNSFNHNKVVSKREELKNVEKLLPISNNEMLDDVLNAHLIQTIENMKDGNDLKILSLPAIRDVKSNSIVYSLKEAQVSGTTTELVMLTQVLEKESLGKVRSVKIELNNNNIVFANYLILNCLN